MACEAGVIPMVLGGKSEVLDVGRRRRFHTRAQRLAIAQRERCLSKLSTALFFESSSSALAPWCESTIACSAWSSE